MGLIINSHNKLHDFLFGLVLIWVECFKFIAKAVKKEVNKKGRGVIVVEDNQSSIFYYKKLLEKKFLKSNILTFSSLNELKKQEELLNKFDTWLIISDYHLESEKGTDVFQYINEMIETAEFILLSSHFSDQEQSELLEYQNEMSITFEMITKPLSLQHFEDLQVI